MIYLATWILLAAFAWALVHGSTKHPTITPTGKDANDDNA